MIAWRRVDDDSIRSEDSAYWVTRAPTERGPVYTAAHQEQAGRATHLGCYDEAAAAKNACEQHAQGETQWTRSDPTTR